MKDKEQGRGGSTGANLSLECVKRGSQLVQSVTYTAHTGFQAGPNQTREKQQNTVANVCLFLLAFVFSMHYFA